MGDHRTQTPPESGQNGFALLLIAAVLLLLGGALLVGTTTQQEADRQVSQRLETRRTLATLEAALVRFVERTGRLPCPADATATLQSEAGRAEMARVAVEGTPRRCGAPSASGAGRRDLSRGAVPWATLGLPARAALDGWQRRITYVVFEGVAGSGHRGSLVQPQGLVLSRCLRAVGVLGRKCPHGVPEVSTIRSLLTGLGLDLGALPRPDFGTLSDPDYRRLTSAVRDAVMAGLGLRLIRGAPDLPAGRTTLAEDVSSSDLMDDLEPRVPGYGAAYVLISRGENGAGAWLPNGSLFAGSPGPGEEENLQGGAARDTPTFRQGISSGGDADGGFDDIVTGMSVLALAIRSQNWPTPTLYAPEQWDFDLDGIPDDLVRAAAPEPIPPCPSVADDPNDDDPEEEALRALVAFDRHGTASLTDGRLTGLALRITDRRSDGAVAALTWSDSTGSVRVQANGDAGSYVMAGTSGRISAPDHLRARSLRELAFCRTD